MAPTVVRSTARKKKNPYGWVLVAVEMSRQTPLDSKLQKPMRKGLVMPIRVSTRGLSFSQASTRWHTLESLSILFKKNSCNVV
jgi:hypothetical protein